MQSLVTKAIVLAAGRGTRMGALTEDLPKPMLPVAGRPLLEHVLNHLQGAGISEVGLIVGYRREVIEQHFASYPLRITFIHQEVINGTAGAAKLARSFVGDHCFLMTFGDIWCGPADYRRILAPVEAEAHVEATLAVKFVDDPFQGAAVYEDQNGFVSRIIEKPPRGTSSTHWNSAGIYCFRPSVFAEIDRVPLSSRGEYEITSAIEQMIEGGRKLRAVEVKGDWRDIGRPEDLASAGSLS
jgi:NDP-sugar pyrophosphorylase family protein